MKVVDYYILSEEDPITLNNKVCQMLSEGWQILGDFKAFQWIERNQPEFQFYQAMMKYEEEAAQ